MLAYRGKTWKETENTEEEEKRKAMRGNRDARKGKEAERGAVKGWGWGGL